MSNSKPQKPSKSSNKNTESIESIKSDIASFASSLGLSSSLPSSGFNDSDFRKTGPLKPYNNNNKPTKTHTHTHNQRTHFGGAKPNNTHNTKTQFEAKPIPKPPVLSLEGGNDSTNNKKFDRFKNMSKLPLVKATSLEVWYVDAMELEEKVLGEERGKRVEVRDVEEWKRVVEKKREIGERLMWQYGVDYESSRGKSGDIKMLVATQRSGTATDKVSAFSVLVGDNPVANLRSLDALLGEFCASFGFVY